MFKVVTVEGSMIETSGTMAGGGAPKAGSMMLQRGSSAAPRPVVAAGEEVTAVQVQNLEASVTNIVIRVMTLESTEENSENEIPSLLLRL
jgi:chromosome segregation ATPase